MPGKKTTDYNALTGEVEQLRFALDNVTSYVYIKDRESRYIYANKMTLELFDCTANDLVGSHDDRFFPPATVKRLREIDLRVLGGESTEEEVVVDQPGSDQRIYHEVKTPIYAADGSQKIVALLGISTDITELRQMENEVRQLALTDPLTRLPNRRVLDDRIERAQQRCRRQNTYSAILFVDLDDFKEINDTHGHGAGDHLLFEVANRLRQEMRDTDTVARLGGDEFVIVLESVGSERKLANRYVDEVMDRIRNALGVDYLIAKQKYNITASIGKTLFKNDSAPASQLLKMADDDMYESKRHRSPQHKQHS